jgi:DNA-binding response OmpR family regulator
MNKITLVEDDATMLSLLQTLLQMEGFEVSHASADDVDGIVSEIRREKPALTLIDVHLHQISGFDILEQIRQDNELKDIYVLMSSGMDVGHKCLQDGADGFILKPYMPDELIKKIQHILNGFRTSA